MRRSAVNYMYPNAEKQPKYDSVEYLICSSDEESMQEVQNEENRMIYNFVDVNNYAETDKQNSEVDKAQSISNIVMLKNNTQHHQKTSNDIITTVTPNKISISSASVPVMMSSVSTTTQSFSKMPPLVLKAPISSLVQSDAKTVTQSATNRPKFTITLANKPKTTEPIKNVDKKDTINNNDATVNTALSEKLSQVDNKLDAFIMETNRRFHVLHILMNKIVLQNDRILENHLSHSVNTDEINIKNPAEIEEFPNEKEIISVVPDKSKLSTTINHPVEIKELEHKIDYLQTEIVKLNRSVTEIDVQKRITQADCMFDLGVDSPAELEDLNKELADGERQTHYRYFIKSQARDIKWLIPNFRKIATDQCLFEYNTSGEQGKFSLKKLTNWVQCFQDTYHISQQEAVKTLAAASRYAKARVHQKRMLVRRKQEQACQELIAMNDMK